MAWFTLTLGVLLMAIGIGGQIFGIRKTAKLATHDRPVRKWVLTVGTLVAGLWIIAFSAAQFLHHQHLGR
jgi:amino acid transporter